MSEQIEFIRAKSSANGTPRYICHYYLLTGKDNTLKIALEIASKIGGKKYRAKSSRFRDFIVFESKNLQTLQKDVRELFNTNKF